LASKQDLDLNGAFDKNPFRGGGSLRPPSTATHHSTKVDCVHLARAMSFPENRFFSRKPLQKRVTSASRTRAIAESH
jgi:hypothetical protein